MRRTVGFALAAAMVVAGCSGSGATSPVEPSTGEDALAVRQCREGYDKLVRDLEERDDETGPRLELDPTVLDTVGVVLSTAVEPDMATVILGGDADVVRCRIPEGGFEGPIPDMSVGHVGGEPSTTGVKVWNPQAGLGVTNGPVTVRFYGRAGAEVQEVSLIAGDGRSPGVLDQGWFLVEMVLEGSLKDLNKIVLEWVTTSGSVNSEVLLEYDEDLGDFVPMLSDPESGAVPTLEAGNPGIEFATCPASTDFYSEITRPEVIELLNSVAGTYTTADELLEIRCVWSPDAQLHRQDQTGSLAQEWSNVLDRTPTFEMTRVLAAGLNPISERSVDGVVIFSLRDPFVAAGLSLEWEDGRWLITEWTYQPTCTDLSAIAADPDLPDSSRQTITAQCP